MPNFSYSALDAGGRPDHGRIEALSGADAYRKLRERGLQPSKVVEEGGVAAKTVKGREGWLVGLVSGFSGTGNAAVTHSGSSKNTVSIAFSSPGELPRLTTPQLLFFTEELAELLDAGLQLEGAQSHRTA